MTREADLALLATGSYWDIREKNPFEPGTQDLDNRAPLPEGWVVVSRHDASQSGNSSSWFGSDNGFSARVYQNTATGEVVISYAGTEFENNWAGTAADFFQGNIPLALGKYSTQAYEAAKLYQRVKADPDLSDNITFTGHSLGGGLASVMAVWFNRPALVYAPAPFQASADGNQLTNNTAAYFLDFVMGSVR